MTTKTKATTEQKSFIDTITQLVKYGTVGVMNTAIDFITLNILLFVFHVYSGPLIILFNSIAFSVAVLNSYYFNKRWTFKDRETHVASQFAKFLVVSVIGAAINSGVVFAVTSYIDPLFGLSKELWANGAKIFATIFVLIWNFAGYRLWAFAEKK